MPRTPQYSQPAPPGYVYADEASRLTGRAIETLYKDRQKTPEENQGPKSETLNRKAVWRLTDIAEWLEEQTAPQRNPERVAENRPPEPLRPRKSTRTRSAKRSAQAYDPAA
ncbi:hypothetical protein [Streptomyces sp. KN37]|uniref:hypothetical protein n=1 Tax=Streptomyces sp. KN37 TaxID=3090667 RepID=UPI002A75A856|nr:hypothetical protein [Streptomyces sp. KN37]WPO70262.1 hypothetical protein R9806_06265 [Streptomyces sp. KN37]